MALCTVEDVKLYLGLESTSQDALLEKLISGASGYIENYTGRVFSVTEYTEKLDGTGKTIMPVSYAPIVSVVSVINSYGIPKEVEHTSTILVLSDGSTFAKGTLNWVITYNAGYEVVPFDVAQACIELVAYKFKDRDRIGINTKTLAGEVVSFEKRDIRGEIKNILAPYVRVV